MRSALHRVLRDYVDAPVTDKLAGAVAALGTRRPVSTVTLGLTGLAVAVPTTRAYGDSRPR